MRKPALWQSRRGAELGKNAFRINTKDMSDRAMALAAGCTARAGNQAAASPRVRAVKAARTLRAELASADLMTDR